MDETGRLAKTRHLAVDMLTLRKFTIFWSKHSTQYVAGRSRVRPPLRPNHGIIIPLMLSPIPLGPLNTIKDRLTMSALIG